ncbi:MAG TPA: serine/threonine-protein kinase, partial [Kofleriaceae bacterium]|nr:serine/threonine-protein kinase [Kofleriaceae bacterium]
VVDPPVNELPPAIDRPRPRAGDSIARPSRSVAPTPTPTSMITTAADAMRDEEVHRTRVFIRLGWIASLGGLSTIPVVEGQRSVTIAFAAALVLGMIVSFGFHHAFADPRRYSSRAIFVLGVMSVINTHVAILYFGAFTLSPLLIVIGLHFIGRSEIPARRAVLVTAMVCHAAIAIALMLGYPDPGVFATDRPLPISAYLIGAVYIQATYALAYMTGRNQRRISLHSIEQLQRATRVASQRAALLEEVRADLERAQHATSGRHTGETIGDYVLDVILGRGAHGEVYEGRHVTTGAPAAVKVLRREHLEDETTVARFVREVRATTAVDSPHIVRVLATSEPTAAQPYLVMERLTGMTLADQLRRTPVLSAAEVLRLVTQVGAAIDAAAAATITHRDLKPQNLFAAGDTWKVLDFGVAALAEHTGTLTRGGIVGTPQYMAPEQARGTKVDIRTDLYALGAIAYRALTGRNAFGGTDAPAILYSVVHTMPVAPTSLAELPADLDRWAALALAKDPAARWASGAELAAQLGDALRGELSDASRAAADRVLAQTPWRTS